MGLSVEAMTPLDVDGVSIGVDEDGFDGELDAAASKSELATVTAAVAAATVAAALALVEGRLALLKRDALRSAETLLFGDFDVAIAAIVVSRESVKRRAEEGFLEDDAFARLLLPLLGLIVLGAGLGGDIKFSDGVSVSGCWATIC